VYADAGKPGKSCKLVGRVSSWLRIPQGMRSDVDVVLIITSPEKPSGNGANGPGAWEARCSGEAGGANAL